jgi:mRNA interferase MazF
MAGILKGSICLAETRPVLVISPDVFNESSGTIIAMALTRQLPFAGYPLTYVLPRLVQMEKAWVKMGQVRTLPVERIGRTINEVAIEDMDRIIQGLYEIIGT